MAKARVILYESKKLKDGTHPLMLRVTIGNKRKYFATKYSLTKSQWDKAKKEPKGTSVDIKRIRLDVRDLNSRANSILYDAEKANKPVDFVCFEEELFNRKIVGYVLSYFKETYENLKKAGKNGNSNAYKNTYGVFSKYRKVKDLLFTELNYREIKKFENYLLGNGLNTNGISFHMRTLRALYNRAIKEGLVDKEHYPFNQYSIKKEKTLHRALSKEEITAIKNFDPKGDISLQLAKDYFMFSFYNRGMNFIDIVYLKTKNLHKGRLNYKRAKTGTSFTIKLVEPAMEIIGRYIEKSKADSFIFPAIQNEEHKFLEYRNAMRLTNKKLNKIGELTNCSIPLTTYVARHSWATIAKRSGVSTSIISEGMGHATEHITQVYLDSFENEVIDEANQKIIDLI